MRINNKLVSGAFLAFGVIVVSFAYGYFAKPQGWFPSMQIEHAKDSVKLLQKQMRGDLPDGQTATKQPNTVVIHNAAAMSPGLTLLTGLDENKGLMVKIVTPEGDVLNRWDLGWFKVFPKAPPWITPKKKIPTEGPGTTIHGLAISPNGDLTYNYTDLAMVQVDVCGRVKWKLPYMTHHTVDRAEDGTFWALDVRERTKDDPDHPNLPAPFRNTAVIQVSNNGKILQRFPIIELLDNSNLQGMYSLATVANPPLIYGDGFHLNDVEVFPSTLKPGRFQPGDVLVSLRNNNTIFVFDPKTRKIKDIETGATVRQHDPDFYDADTITIFDNNHNGSKPGKESSRIVEYSFATRTSRVLFEGNKAHPFFTPETGNHQNLPNGNILISEGQTGRALEITRAGEIVWEYFNHIAPDRLGEMPSAERLDPKVWTPAYVKSLTAACPARK